MPDDSVIIQTIASGPKIATFKDAGDVHHQRAILDIDVGGVPTKVGPAEPLPVLEWIQAVREGLIAGYATMNIQGHTPLLGSPFQTIWDDPSLVDVWLLTSAVTVKVASEDVTDTLVGSGAQKVRIIGLDDVGAAQTVDVDLAGQAEVTTTEIWSAVNFLQVLAAGSARKNAGRIWCGNGTFTLGVPTVKYNLIEATFTLSKTGIFTVPAGKTGLLWSAVFMVGDTTKPVDIHLHADDGAIDRVIAPFELGSGTLATRSPGAAPLLAGQMLKVEGVVGTGTASFASLLVLVLKDTP